MACDGQGQLADFVEKQRTAVGRFEESGLVVGGARERAAHVAEQFALKERLDHGRAVDGDEALRAARAQLVKRARDEFLARPGLSADERRSHVRRQPSDEREHVLHHGAAADHAAELEPLREVALEREHIAMLRRFVADRREELTNARQIERLGQVVASAELDRFDGAVDGAVAGHQHDAGARIDLANRPQHVEPRDAGHPHVEQHEVGRPLLELSNGVVARRRRDDVEPFSQGDRAHQREDGAVVVCNEEAWALALHQEPKVFYRQELVAALTTSIQEGCRRAVAATARVRRGHTGRAPTSGVEWRCGRRAVRER